MIEDLIAYIKANLSVTRIYPQQAPLNATLPCLVWYLDGVQRYQSFDGTNTLKDSDFQLDIWADTSLAATTLQRELATLLEDFTGTMGSTRIDWTEITGENVAFDTATELYNHSLFITFSHR
jgi:hypothetical protein